MGSDRQPIFNVPMIILALVGVLGLVHAILAYATLETTEDVLELFAFVPLRYSPGVPIGSLPGGWGAAIWTFVTYAFLHIDISHLLFNLLWLVAFGTPVARRFGAWRFSMLYLVTAAAGAATHLAVHFGEMNPMIGASASVSGAMAAAMRFAFQPGGPLGRVGRGDENSYRTPAAPLSAMFRNPRLLVFLLVWFGTNLVFGLISLPGVEGRVAWEAHVGGFIAGLIGFALFDPVRAAPAGDQGTQPDDDAVVH